MIITKESHAQKLKRVADALKTGFWLGGGYDVKLYKEIQVPTNGGECRFDYVMRIRPKLDRNDKSKYRGDLVRFHGFELKLSKQDLKQDDKFLNYLEHVHLFYFAVTSSLVPTAIEKLKPFTQIGIVDIETMQVIRAAKKSDVAPANRLRLMSQMLF